MASTHRQHSGEFSTDAIIHEGCLGKSSPGKRNVKRTKRFCRILKLRADEFERTFKSAKKQKPRDKDYPKKQNFIFCLAYWESSSQKYPVRVISLYGCNVTETTENEIGGEFKSASSFTLVTPIRKFFFQADTPVSKKEWMDNLKCVMQGIKIQEVYAGLTPIFSDPVTSELNRRSSEGKTQFEQGNPSSESNCIFWTMTNEERMRQRNDSGVGDSASSSRCNSGSKKPPPYENVAWSQSPPVQAPQQYSDLLPGDQKPVYEEYLLPEDRYSETSSDKEFDSDSEDSDSSDENVQRSGVITPPEYAEIAEEVETHYDIAEYQPKVRNMSSSNNVRTMSLCDEHVYNLPSRKKPVPTPRAQSVGNKSGIDRTISVGNPSYNIKDAPLWNKDTEREYVDCSGPLPLVNQPVNLREVAVGGNMLITFSGTTARMEMSGSNIFVYSKKILCTSSATVNPVAGSEFCEIVIEDVKVKYPNNFMTKFVKGEVEIHADEMRVDGSRLKIKQDNGYEISLFQ